MPDAEAGHVVTTPSEATATPNQSVFNLVNGILGVGVLGFPYAFKMCGLTLATALLLFIAAVTLFSTKLLLLSSQLTGKQSYEDLACHLLGNMGRHVVNFSVIVINLGAIISYLNVLADVLSSVSGTMIPPGLEPSRNSVLLGVTIFAVLPVSVYVQDAASLACVSIGSVGIIIVFTLMMVLSAMNPVSDTTKITYWQMNGAFVSFPVIAYGFTVHTVIFPVYSLLHSPTVPKMVDIVKKATFMCGSVYLLVGIGGYLTFGDRTHGDILRNLGAVDVLNPISMRWFYERMLKVAYGASIVGTVPLVILPSLSLLLPMLYPCCNLSRITAKRLIALAFVAVSYTCAVLIPNVEFILGLNGGTSSILLAYIMPGLLYLKATAKAESSALKHGEFSWDKKWKARALVVMGVALAFLCTAATLQAVHEEKQVVTLVQDFVDKTKEQSDVIAAGQSAINAVKTVDAVQAANDEIGTVRDSTVETLETLHMSAKDLSQTLGLSGEKEGSELQSDVRKKYENVLATIGIIVQKVDATLESVQRLQTKLKSLSEEIQSRQKSEEDKVASDDRINNLVKQLTTVLGISVEDEEGIEERTLDNVQKEYDIAVEALKETIVILTRVQGDLKKALDQGREGANLRESIVSAMEQAIHATTHSALALDLTSNVLSETAEIQKSEVINILSEIAKESETEGVEEGSDGAGIYNHSMFVSTEVAESSVNAAITGTVASKQQSVDKAQDAIRSAENKNVAAKADAITKELNQTQATTDS